MLVILPLSKEAVVEIMQQVAARGQPERICEVDGKLAIDLRDVVVVDDPQNMVKAN